MLKTNVCISGILFSLYWEHGYQDLKQKTRQIDVWIAVTVYECIAMREIMF